MISPRAADDFATIRARLEELRRERAEASPEAVDEPSDIGASSSSNAVNLGLKHG